MSKQICPCCGFRTIEKKGEFEICPVCYWEDDPMQNRHPEMPGGANSVSLTDARENYLKYGASEEKYVKYCRKPEVEELCDEGD